MKKYVPKQPLLRSIDRTLIRCQESWIECSWLIKFYPRAWCLVTVARESNFESWALNSRQAALFWISLSNRSFSFQSHNSCVQYGLWWIMDGGRNEDLRSCQAWSRLNIQHAETINQNRSKLNHWKTDRRCNLSSNTNQLLSHHRLPRKTSSLLLLLLPLLPSCCCCCCCGASCQGQLMQHNRSFWTFNNEDGSSALHAVSGESCEIIHAEFCQWWCISWSEWLSQGLTMTTTKMTTTMMTTTTTTMMTTTTMVTTTTTTMTTMTFRPSI